MSINPISSNISSLLNPEATKAVSDTGSVFSDILTDTFNNAEATDKADKGSALELLSGTSDDMSAVLIDAEKAEIALSLTLQIRNKVVDAYNEIMTMQV
ncbi:MAG: flagellar hook-basal body complex protein FliE [Oscillospiraceae bacterium]|jgi:flagellar hook-basal body complex protein FliE|nr:flagellar hook-basal body complex protein FliE [Oscillospiraceae bacterium]